jgi:hypothetical protein
MCNFFCKNSSYLLIIINNSTNCLKSNKIINRYLNHLATTIDTSASRRRALVLNPPSPELGKNCRSRACCNRQMRSRHATAPKDQRVAKDDNRRSEERPETTPTNTKTDRIPGNPLGTQLQAPSANARHAIRARVGQGVHYSNFKT